VAAPGEGDALAAFLASARETAAREEGTVTWYAFKLSDTTYGIFDIFASEDDRNAHLAGGIPVALARRQLTAPGRAADAAGRRVWHRQQLLDGRCVSTR